MPCIFFSLKEFALINPERSSTKETERKETTAEEELDPEVLNVFHPTHEWQALQPGTRPSPVPMKHSEFNCICPLSPQGYFEGATTLWPARGNNVVHQSGGCSYRTQGPSFSCRTEIAVSECPGRGMQVVGGQAF